MSVRTKHTPIESAPALSEALLHRFDAPAPPYSSFPAADRFVVASGPPELCHALQQRALGAAGSGGAPLSVYVHIPFCESVCYYCACNKVITRHHERAAEYLDALDCAIERVVAQGVAESVGGGLAYFEHVRVKSGDMGGVALDKAQVERVGGCG